MRIILNLILIKHSGTGGHNVAKNFFIQTLSDKENEWFYFVSNEFDQEIDRVRMDIDEKHYYVFHSQPSLLHYFFDKHLVSNAESIIKPDIVYSILAPCYYTFKTVEVMRCANAWAVIGGVNKYALRVTPFKLKFRYFIKARITRMLMRKTKYFITQSEIAKACILRTVHTTSDNVCVVSNVLPKDFQDYCPKKKPHTGFNMVYASSPAVHKDYLILPQVASILINRYGMKDFQIHVTIPSSAYSFPLFNSSMRKLGVESCFVNHGFLKREDLATVFSQCDLGLFPSLLETFSATLLEYMCFKLPIVSSNLPFNKDVAENAAVYFEPHNAEDFAEKIYKVYCDEMLRDELMRNAVNKLMLYSDNTDKYDETVGFLRRVAEKEIHD